MVGNKCKRGIVEVCGRDCDCRGLWKPTKERAITDRSPRLALVVMACHWPINGIAWGIMGIALGVMACHWPIDGIAWGHQWHALGVIGFAWPINGIALARRPSMTCLPAWACLGASMALLWAWPRITSFCILCLFLTNSPCWACLLLGVA